MGGVQVKGSPLTCTKLDMFIINVLNRAVKICCAGGETQGQCRRPDRFGRLLKKTIKSISSRADPGAPGGVTISDKASFHLTRCSFMRSRERNQ